MPISNNKTSKTPAILLIILGSSFLVIAAAWFTFNNQTPPESIRPGEPLRISLSYAKTAFDQGKAIFLDTRSLESFNEVHIAGAISFPEGDVLDRLGGLAKEDWIIPYCT
ncbi:MAG: rhodanese-like domain-containing protein [Anaerolineaceae bacterium]|nr:rhodanese-like domain-containing protein [Anaerolineaceae bacterium]